MCPVRALSMGFWRASYERPAVAKLNSSWRPLSLLIVRRRYVSGCFLRHVVGKLSQFVVLSAGLLAQLVDYLALLRNNGRQLLLHFFMMGEAGFEFVDTIRDIGHG
jgi:hypothetical protein